MCAVSPWLNIITLKKTTAQGPKNILQIRKDDIFKVQHVLRIAEPLHLEWEKWQYLYSTSKTYAALSLALCIWSNIVLLRTSEKWRILYISLIEEPLEKQMVTQGPTW